jgi:hypothetical protein
LEGSISINGIIKNVQPVFAILAQIGARLFVLRDGTMIILSPADEIKNKLSYTR